MKNNMDKNSQIIIYNSMIAISSLMIVSSLVTAIGIVLWIKNVNFVTGYSSEAQFHAAGTGAWMGVIGGIITIVLALISLVLFIERIILIKRFGKSPSTVKSVVSIILFIISWLPPLIFLLIELFRFL